MVDTSMTVARESILWVCAREQLTLSARSRWLQIFAIVFAGLATAVASSGYVLSGGSGVQDFSRTAASLLQLVLLLVPLTSVLLSVIALTPEAGAAELLFSQPVDRHRILVGRLSGLLVALVASQAIGFGAAGVIVFLQAGDGGVEGFLAIVGASAALTAVFLTVGAAIVAGRTSEDRTRGMAVAIVIWFAAVLLFDVVVLGAASRLPSGPASRLLIVSVIVNPVDAVRTWALLAIEGTAAFGAASLAFLRVTGGATTATIWLTASIAAWTVAPLAVAIVRLRRADI
jgi:Cu-processing system permease protein